MAEKISDILKEREKRRSKSEMADKVSMMKSFRRIYACFSWNVFSPHKLLYTSIFHQQPTTPDPDHLTLSGMVKHIRKRPNRLQCNVCCKNRQCHKKREESRIHDPGVVYLVYSAIALWCNELKSTTTKTGPPSRSSTNAGRGLQLVHRRF